MKITFQYGSGVLNLPADLMGVLGRADADALRVLIALSAQGAGDVDRAAVAALCGCDEGAVDTAIAFWRGAGLIAVSDGKAAPAPKTTRSKAAPPKTAPTLTSDQAEPARPSVTVKNSATSLPAYTTEELANVLERRRELTALVDECSRVFGKVFNTHEVGQLIGLADYLGLEGEYILLLLAHCNRMGKRSLRYAVSLAESLYDENITDTAALQECLKEREMRAECEGQLRSMFGIGSRALTAKEKKMFDAWINVHHLPPEVIRMAFERTVNATGKPSVPYTNSILERWVAAGLTTPELILASEDAYAKEQQSKAAGGAAALGNSFDTEDFLSAALRRSYGDDYPAADASQNNKSKGDAK